MTLKTIRLQIEGRIGRLSLARAEKRNAINDLMLGEIASVFAGELGEVSALILDAEGSTFCAGLDLAEHAARSPEQAMATSARWHRVVEAIGRGPPPVIAALKGHVIGGGLEIAAAAHIRIAEADCRFALPEGRHGIFVGGGASVTVGRLIGTSRMMEMMLTGRIVDAEEALRIGLVHHVVPVGTALERAQAMAATVAENAPLSNLMMLQALPRIAEMAPAEGMFTESLAVALTQSSGEAAERMRRFIEKRHA